VARSPDYQRDGISLYLGDCLEILPEIGAVDAVVTDPPYGNSYSTGYRKGIYRPSTRITGDILSEPLLNDVAAELEPLLNDVAAELEPLLNDVAAVYWFAAPDRLDMVLPILKRWNVVNVLCWDKGNCSAGDLDCSYGKQWEACVYAVTKKFPLAGSRDRDVLQFSRGDTSGYVHPTQKPCSLIEYILRKCPGTLTLDPFMGSGTAGVACIKTGRQFIGIELEPRYFDIAVKRIDAALDIDRDSLWTAKQLAEQQRPLFE